MVKTIGTARQVGQAVRDRRHELGLTQKQLAAAAGVSERFLIALELGDATGARLDKVMCVLGQLGLSLGVFPAQGGEVVGAASEARSQTPSSASFPSAPPPQSSREEYDEAFNAMARSSLALSDRLKRAGGWL